MPDPADDLEVVALEALARTAAEAQTAPGELAVEGLDGDGHPGRKPLDDDNKSRSVGLPAGQEAQHAPFLSLGGSPIVTARSGPTLRVRRGDPPAI